MKKLQDKVEKLQKYDSSVSIGQNYFFSDGVQPDLIFHTLSYTLRKILFTVKLYYGTLKVYLLKVLLHLIITFLQQLNGMEIQIFV